jgi:hypothetical protein
MTQPVTNFQRIGSVSNSHVGVEFEAAIATCWTKQGLVLTPSFPLPVGQPGRESKIRKFDLGSASPKVIVECKSHKWTAGGNMPSAKLTVWNESMYYFSLAPRDYRKMFCVLADRRSGRAETLAQYYVRCHSNLIPMDVEVWEFDPISAQCTRLWG